MNAPLSNKIITLDGNIGVGKSTLLERVRAQCPEVLVVQEPVTMWTTLQNEQGASLLELFYGDKRRWSYTFQNAAILSRIKCLKEALAVAKPGQLILTERSVLTDRYVFAAMLREQGCLDALEGSLYDMWFEAFANDFPVSAIVYLTTGPAVAAERIKRRARGGEAEIDTSTQKAHRHTGGAFAAGVAAKAKALFKIRTDLSRAAAWFAWVVRPV